MYNLILVMDTFGTSAVSSAGTNASGNGQGKFEYDVPTGYTALFNKGVKRIIMAYTTVNKSTQNILIL